MRRKPKYCYGGKAFNSKQAVVDHANSIKAKVKLGQIIKEPSDFDFIKDLLANHPEAKTKIGIGIKDIFVDKSPDYPTTCFWIRRNDGSKTDFGINSCVKEIETINKESFRYTISEFNLKLRESRIPKGALVFVSDYSGKQFPVEGAVISSAPSFDEIVKAFCTKHHVDVASALLTEPVDNNSIPVWKDRTIPDAFRAEYLLAKHLLVDRSEALGCIRKERPQKESP